MKRFVFIVMWAVLMYSCSGTRPVPSDKSKEKNSVKFDESFDPRTLNDDDIVIARNVTAKMEQKTEKTGSTQPTDNNYTFKEVNGFRVQIFVSKDFEKATLVREEAREIFKDLGYQTYLVFESNMYKVRVGDARNREDAEKIRDEAWDRNYREAFIVRAKVRVPVTP